MKTKNNVQKAVIKSFAVITSLVLLSFTVNGQNFWKRILENTGFDQIALAMVSTNEITYSEAGSATFFQVEQENQIALENWMMEDANFESSFFQVETENNLELETWMTNQSQFERNNFTQSETETKLKLEGWMVNSENWRE